MTPTEAITQAKEVLEHMADYPTYRQAQSDLAEQLEEYTPAQEYLAQRLYNKIQLRLKQL